MARVIFDHVTKRFGDVTAVNDLSLEVRDKEFLVLVGPSGCGKSTALRLVAGLEEATKGDIYIDDQLVNEVPPKNRDIAMVFQSYALYPHMTVYDNMAFGLRQRKMPKAGIDKRVKSAAQILGIGELLKRKPKQLSGGERQRAALGRAIVREPKVFLMDEPLSNLDAKLRVQTRTEISKLHQRLQTTVIYVTHDQIEAMTMGDRIAVLKDGILQQLDTPQNLYDKPANVFVGGFIGSPAMNFFTAKLVGGEEEMRVDSGAFRVRVPQDRKGVYKGRLGEEVIFGLRPESIQNRVFANSAADDFTVRVVVEVVEPMGSEAYLYLLAGQHSFIARADARSAVRPGDEMEVVFDMSQMHLFDKNTELAIG